MRPSRLSVVMPLFNNARFVAEAVSSLLVQDRLPLEILVVDDGSDDGGADVVQDIGPPARCVRQARSGSGAARNRGVDLASGECIFFLDSDDRIRPGALDLLHEALEAEPQVDVVFGKMSEFLDSDLGEAARRKVRAPRSPRPGRLMGTMLIRRDALLRVGRFSETLLRGETVDWFARAAEHDLAERRLPQVVLERRLHGANNGVVQLAAGEGEYLRVVRETIARRRAARADE